MIAPPTVFVVDDDPAARHSFQKLAKSHGQSCIAFPSAEAFLEQDRPSGAGCLVLDLRMRDMSGLELQKVLNIEGLRMPVIIVTGHADVKSTIEALKSGAVTLLEKPCCDETLWNHVQQALDLDIQRRQQAAEHEELRAKIARLPSDERALVNRLVAGERSYDVARDLRVSTDELHHRRSEILTKIGVGTLAELVEKLLAGDATV
ncbi:MAG: response regulator transcription factor [Planctomycetes bacterium]|nr:response regulator transcription factor [Planctomycetota bacterium]